MGVQIYYFNKVFKKYILDYTRDIENIFLLKNGKIDIGKYVYSIIDGSIGFEGCHFYLSRIQRAFVLIDLLWKIMLTHDREYVIFNYTFEVIINQVFEEYLFIKNIIRQLEDEFSSQKDKEWIVNFLYFYENFVWKNKKMIEMYANFDWFFKQRLINCPKLFKFEEKVTKVLNKELTKYRDKVDKKKHWVNNEIGYEELSDKAKEYFERVSRKVSGTEQDWLLFSKNSILNKLDNGYQKKSNTSIKDVVVETDSENESESEEEKSFYIHERYETQ